MPRKRKKKEEEVIEEIDKIESKIDQKVMNKQLSDLITVLFGSTKEFMRDSIATGYIILKEYDVLARELGFENTIDFVRTAVRFFVEKHNKIESLEKKITDLELENALLKIAVSEEMRKQRTAEILRSVFIMMAMHGYSVEDMMKVADFIKGTMEEESLEKRMERLAKVVELINVGEDYGTSTRLEEESSEDSEDAGSGGRKGRCGIGGDGLRRGEGDGGE